MQSSHPPYQGVEGHIQWFSLAALTSEISLLLLQLAFSIRSLSLLVYGTWSCEEVTLYSLCVLGSLGSLVGARQVLGDLPCQAGRAPIRDTLFILLAPFIWTQNGLWGVWLEHTAVISQADQNTQMELPLALSRWKGLFAMEFTGTFYLEEFLKILDRPCSFPDFSSWSSLIYSSEVVQSVLSCQKSRDTDFCTGAYFDVLVGGGEFTVHPHHGLQHPPTWWTSSTSSLFCPLIWSL